MVLRWRQWLQLIGVRAMEVYVLSPCGQVDVVAFFNSMSCMGI